MAGRYAAALFELAEEKAALDSVASDLTQLKAAVGESVDLRRLLESPLYSREAQVKALEAILAKARAQVLTKHFVLLVAKNRRLFVLVAMIDAFLAALAAHRGEVTAQVRAARPLSDAQLSSLTEALRRSVGQKVKVAVTVDEELLGGLVVQVGSRLIDGSLRNKLQKLQHAMKGAE